MILYLCLCFYKAYYEYIRGIEGWRLWQYEWQKNRESEFRGAFHTIMEQASEDPEQFIKSVRMDYNTFNTFNIILNKIRNKIQKIYTNFGKCISPEM